MEKKNEKTKKTKSTSSQSEDDQEIQSEDLKIINFYRDLYFRAVFSGSDTGKYYYNDQRISQKLMEKAINKNYSLLFGGRRIMVNALVQAERNNLSIQMEKFLDQIMNSPVIYSVSKESQNIDKLDSQPYDHEIAMEKCTALNTFPNKFSSNKKPKGIRIGSEQWYFMTDSIYIFTYKKLDIIPIKNIKIDISDQCLKHSKDPVKEALQFGDGNKEKQLPQDNNNVLNLWYKKAHIVINDNRDYILLYMNEDDEESEQIKKIPDLG